MIYAIDTPPEDQMLASLEYLIRTSGGILPTEAWASGVAPDGHWMMPAGAQLYRYDIPAKVDPPCAILYLDKDSAPYTGTVTSGMWWLYCAVDLIWDRDLTTQQTREIRSVLQHMLTSDMTDAVAADKRRAIDRLSWPATFDKPGMRVLALRNIICTNQKTDKGHPEFNLTFEARCAGIVPLQIIPDLAVDTTFPAPAYTDAGSAFYFRQSTAGRRHTLAAPSDASRKAITVRNDGPAAFTLDPQGLSGGVAIGAYSETLLHWDAPLASWAPGL